MDRHVDQSVERSLGDGGGAYQKEARIYPRSVTGKFARLRSWSMYVLLGLYYGVVWLRWDGRQAVLFDLPARKFHIFGLTFWPQDFIYLALLLLLLALLLFFITAVAGRLWCGYACPQTVWTEAFMLMEKWTEGDRAKRMKLDRGPWNRNKLLRKSAKQFLWITFSLWTGFTFVGYFTPVLELAADVVAFRVSPWALFWIVFYGFATYGNAGFLREQVCKYMCPYARFQSAMFDKDTLTIAYNERRGEPRGSRRRTSDPKALKLGDCIDCTLCVQVCPTGIDIRDGLQYECIACAACIDVCDQVMEKMDYPPGLISYTTEHAVSGQPTRVLRPRVLLYAALLLLIAAGMVASIATRTPLRMEVVRDRNALYRVAEDQQIENVYTLRIINMSPFAQDYNLTVTGPPGLATQAPALHVGAGQTGAFAIRLRLAPVPGTPRLPVTLQVTARDDPTASVTRESGFFMPMERS